MKIVDEQIKKSIIIVNKPPGLTSREVVNRVKNILKCKKAGHAGTLDPNATGVLIIALNEAVKTIPVFMGLDKEYEGVMYLHKDVDLKTLENFIYGNFVGEIIQIPPVKSRVARKPRKRIVYNFKILEKNEKNVKFRTKVEAGVYIRKLVSDIGEKIGVGAHLKKLKRTKVGHFTIKNSHSLEEIKSKKFLEKMLIPLEKTIPHVKKVWVKDSAISRIKNGAPIFSEDIVKASKSIEKGEIVGIFSIKESLIALGISKTNNLKIKRGSVIKTDRVFLV